MVFDDWSICGVWVSGRFVFNMLAGMTIEEIGMSYNELNILNRLEELIEY